MDGPRLLSPEGVVNICVIYQEVMRPAAVNFIRKVMIITKR